jgi:hypothetical protein
MKKMVCLMLPIVVLACAVGCDESALPGDVKSLVAASAISSDAITLGTQTQAQSRLQLQDGSCDGAGNQYGGANGQGASNGAGGNGAGDRDRLRDGSCGD